MKHSFRKSALESEKTYELTEGGIAITDSKSEETKTLAYSRIAEIKLGFLAKKNMPDDYYCQIKTKNNNEIRIQSQHYKGIASFEDRGSSYSPFITELHNRLADSDVSLVKGMNSTMYWVQMLFFLLMGIVMFIIALAALIPYGIFIILMLVYLFFRLKKHFVKNKPGSYKFDELPEALLAKY